MIRPTAGHEGCGIHVPDTPNKDHQAIEWTPATNAYQRARQLQWTCQSRRVVYYLLSAGGRLIIKKVDGREAFLSPPMLYPDGEELWSALLRGDAA
ncbi:hypothetical protein [Sphaerimonospora mesophila]|uniref:hypothetical protein n=1 Tax=Sphaerimonospora mesophila TaxID=37483 RepID=UPI0006E2BE4E